MENRVLFEWSGLKRPYEPERDEQGDDYGLHFV